MSDAQDVLAAQHVLHLARYEHRSKCGGVGLMWRGRLQARQSLGELLLITTSPSGERHTRWPLPVHPMRQPSRHACRARARRSRGIRTGALYCPAVLALASLALVMGVNTQRAAAAVPPARRIMANVSDCDPNQPKCQGQKQGQDQDRQQQVTVVTITITNVITLPLAPPTAAPTATPIPVTTPRPTMTPTPIP